MSEQRQIVDIGSAWDIFPENSHICLIYDNETHRDQVVHQFIAAGLRKGELVRYFADRTAPDTVKSWVSDAGYDPARLAEQGMVRIAAAEAAYCPSGRFDPPTLIAGMLHNYDEAKRAGFPGVRSCGEMTWALRDIPGADRLMEYELLISTVPDTFPHIGMCQYDARQFDGATLFKVLEVHPHLIAGSQLVRNPYYLRMEDFLAKYGQGS